MKICPKCGSACGDDDVFCGGCGYQLKEVEKAGYAAEGENQNVNETVNPAVPNPQTARTNPFALTALILGIASIATIACCGFGFIPAILAIVFGFISRGAIRESRGGQIGLGYSTAGIALGFIAIALVIIGVILFSAFGIFAQMFTDMQNDAICFLFG